MDNASFHKSKKTRKLIALVNYRIAFLPPYSPDLNPIGKFWANMKCWIKNQITEFDQLYEAISLKYLIQSKLLYRMMAFSFYFIALYTQIST
ncbi:IS630 family transposase domain protein [Rickettsiales endosymbiont of Paramecium tredecaurelia]|uniref:transposase n=1 Tax=Candidatus Sarmatiella mevalonica TaxID=2770581 RepID=UPI0019219E20|nr:IS630 family transposase domain protein [Candidatus Sarmatiella mevalonica]